MAKITVKKPESTATPENIEVFNIERVHAPFHVRGLSTLLVNNFSEKSRQQLEDESTGVAIKQKRGSAGKAARVPETEFENARIKDADGHDCVPARWIKAALVTAAAMPDTGLSKTLARQSIFIIGDLIPILDKSGNNALPHIQSDMVRRGRFGSKVPMMAYRAAFDAGWELKFTVEFEPKLISHDKLAHLVRRAGLSVGLCEWRPEKNGECGRFDLAAIAVTVIDPKKAREVQAAAAE